MTSDLTDPISLSQALIRCPSVTPDEGGALSLLQSVLELAGFECHRLAFSESGTPDVENLYARAGTVGPNLCFAGHTDVVPPGDLAQWTLDPFSAEIRDGVLYGRGAVDMKGAVACFAVAAIDYLKTAPQNRPAGSISFLITGDEEGPAINGTAKVLDWLSKRGEVLDGCVVGEPTNPSTLGDAIKIGRRGSVNGEIVVHGLQGHAAYPAKASNPIPKLAAVIEHLSRVAIDEGTDDFEPSRLQVTIVSVPNTATNVIPGEARATFNIRYNSRWNRKTIEAWVEEQCATIAASNDARLDVKFWGTGDVFLTKPGPLVDTMSQAIQQVTDRTPQLSTGGGTSDARFIKDACPVIEFGLVNKTIHQVDEHVAVSDLERLTKIYRQFIEAYFLSTAG